jgi:trk system potassium uptake protein TrkA
MTPAAIGAIGDVAGRVRYASRLMKAVIMGCGRVGILLTQELCKAGHDVTVIDKRAQAFDRLPPGFNAKTIVGLGFDRDVLDEAGVDQADAFIAVSSGDNSNIVSARVALEHYHVQHVIARIYDPARADIYERLNIPTVATTKWGVKQIMLMLSHPREDVRESLAGGDLFRMRLKVPPHLVGKHVSSLNADGRILVAGIDRGGKGFIPVADSTFKEGDYVALVVKNDALDQLDELMAPVAEH